jgi:hypothetical protein
VILYFILCTGKGPVRDSQIIPGQCIIKRIPFESEDVQGFMICLYREMAVFRFLLRFGKSTIGISQVVLGMGIIERGLLEGEDLQGFPAGFDS